VEGLLAILGEVMLGTRMSLLYRSVRVASILELEREAYDKVHANVGC
jgi:hypothetical protein